MKIMYFIYFPIENGDIPASYVSLPKGKFRGLGGWAHFLPNDKDCMGRVIVCLPTALP